MFPSRGITIIATLVLMLPLRAWANDHAQAEEHGVSAHAASASFEQHAPGVLATIWHTFSQKLEHMQTLDENNEGLRKRTALLEVENAQLAEQYTACRDGKRSEHLKAEARHEGGHEAARTVASLSTADEALLSHPPKAIFAQAVAAFNKQDFETAAKAFDFLATHRENDSYKNASTSFQAGVSLYKVGNYKKALWHFEQAQKRAQANDLSYAPRAMGWIALCKAKLGDKVGEKRTVRELIERYPKSKEARRLNRHA